MNYGMRFVTLYRRQGFRDPLWRPQERPVIMRVARGPLVIALGREDLFCTVLPCVLATSS